jgi:hypothetical protein
MTVEASGALILIGGVIALLSCFFVCSAVLLAIVLIRHGRRRGALELNDLSEKEVGLDDLAGDEAATDPPA